MTERAMKNWIVKYEHRSIKMTCSSSPSSLRAANMRGSITISLLNAMMPVSLCVKLSAVVGKN